MKYTVKAYNKDDNVFGYIARPLLFENVDADDVTDLTEMFLRFNVPYVVEPAPEHQCQS